MESAGAENLLNRVRLLAMFARSWLLFLVVLMAAANGWCADEPTPIASQPKPVLDLNHPPRGFDTANAAGWRVWVERELALEHAELARKAVSRLEKKLALMRATLPASASERLGKIEIFLLLGEQSRLGGRNNGAEYFQKSAPQFHPELDPRMGGNIVIYSAKNYVELSELWAVKVLMHEFAHGWQLEQWPEKQPDILAAYEAAMSAKLYRRVREDTGQTVARAYAATNHLEYFAELSCAYFVGCNYFPANRSDLEKYDRAGFEMIRKMWVSAGAK